MDHHVGYHGVEGAVARQWPIVLKFPRVDVALSNTPGGRRSAKERLKIGEVSIVQEWLEPPD
jgi:hypothetical protein